MTQALQQAAGSVTPRRKTISARIFRVWCAHPVPAAQVPPLAPAAAAITAATGRIILPQRVASVSPGAPASQPAGSQPASQPAKQPSAVEVWCPQATRRVGALADPARVERAHRLKAANEADSTVVGCRDGDYLRHRVPRRGTTLHRIFHRARTTVATCLTPLSSTAHLL